MTYNLSSEFKLEGILFQWAQHSASEFKLFSPMMNSRYSIKLPKQEMIVNVIFVAGISRRL